VDGQTQSTAVTSLATDAALGPMGTATSRLNSAGATRWGPFAPITDVPRSNLLLAISDVARSRPELQPENAHAARDEAISRLFETLTPQPAVDVNVPFELLDRNVGER